MNFTPPIPKKRNQGGSLKIIGVSILKYNFVLT